MRDNPLQRYLARPPNDMTAMGRHDEDAVEDFAAFGMLRGSRERASMLELRRKDGCILAVSYGFIRSVTFDPVDGITLHLDEQAIRITGRRLNAEDQQCIGLLRGIIQHRVQWIQQADRAAILVRDERSTVVGDIAW